MKQKPSGRVDEIFSEKGIEAGNPMFEARLIESVIQYLDEEYERNKPCEHKNIGGDVRSPIGVCLDCGATNNPFR